MIKSYQSSAANLYQSVKRLLSRSEAFQAFVDCDSATTARDRIYFEGFPENPANGKEYGKAEYSAWLPCAIIRLPYADAGMNGKLTEFSSSFERWGTVDIIFESAVPGAEQRNNVPKPDFMFKFVTHMSQILDELIVLRGQPDPDGQSIFDFHSFSFLTFLYTAADKVPQTGLNIQTLFSLEYGREV